MSLRGVRPPTSRPRCSATTCCGWCSPAATRRWRVETQVALALRTLCGLSTAEVARALLVPEATMAKRLTRAKQKIARAAIPYRRAGRRRAARPAARGRRRRSTCCSTRATRAPGRRRPGCRRGGPAGPAAARAHARRAVGARPAGAACCCTTPGAPPGSTPTGDPVLLADQDRRLWRRGHDRGGRRARRRGPAPHPGPARPLRRPGRDRRLPRTGPDRRGHRLGRGRCPGTTCCSTVHDTPVVRLNRAVAVGERAVRRRRWRSWTPCRGSPATRSGTRPGPSC